jgi:hypothetical protein
MSTSYFFGNGSYNSVLEQLSKTKVNSEKTSSIPLADFWHPRNNDEIKKIIIKLNRCGFNLDDARLLFEYPTDALDDNGKKLLYSGPSMTDLMIINNDCQKIAIESKYTEYVEGKDESVDGWLGKNPKAHKVDILRKWGEYIQKSGGLKDINLEDNNFYDSFKNVSYQFIHRTASACYNSTKPILIYQLFCDDKNTQKLTDFIKDLKTWGQQIKLTIPFYIITVPVKNGDEVHKRYSEMKSELFLKMKENKIYTFKWEDIEVSQVTI